VNIANPSSLTPTSIRFQAWNAMVKVRPHRGDRLRRALNVSAAAVLIALAAPVMFVIALLVRLTSRGPVIYKQERVGLDRRVDRAPSGLNPRRSRDMGGQLFHVLKGDMNLVGPRPEQPQIFQDIRQQLGYYRRRQRVLPGITGLAQVSLPYDSDLDDVRRKVDLDLEYLRKRSPGEDLRIMVKTMPVMVGRKGAR